MDTVSRLIKLDPDIYQKPEPEGHEYGYCVFEQLPSISSVQCVLHKSGPEINEIYSSPADPAVDIKLHITQERLHQLEQQTFVNKYGSSCKPCRSSLGVNHLSMSRPLC